MRIVRAGIGRVDIGRLTDNEARAFAFDVTEMLECMDDGYNISCYATAPNSNDAYLIPPDKYYIEGTDLIWIITDVETAQTGTGKFAITLYNDSGQVVNSQIYKTRVEKSLVGDADPPSAWDNYLLTIEALRDETLDIAEDLVDDVTAIKEEAEDARDDAQDYAERIENMTASASVDANVGVPTVTITKTENPLNLDFAFSNLKGAKGDTGDKGDKGDTGATGSTGATGNGIASISKTGTSGLVDTYTITYTDGDTDTFTVTNGAKGETGDGWTAAQSAKLDALPSLAGTDGRYIIEQGQGHMALYQFKYTYMFTGDIIYKMTNNSFHATVTDGSYSTFMSAFTSGEADSALFFATIYVDVDGDDIGDTMVGYMLFNITGASTSLNFTTLFDGRPLGFAEVCYVQLEIDTDNSCYVKVVSMAQQPVTITLSEASVTLTPSPSYGESIHYILTNNAITDITIYDYDCPLYDIVFTTGATAPTLSIGSGRPIYFPDGTVPTLEPNTRYEINVKDTYAVVASWT